MSAVKNAVLHVAMSRPARRLLAPLMRDRACVFMLHRFAQPERGVQGHDPAVVRAVLAWLRREGFELVRLDDLVARLRGDGPPLRRAVAFTIDDGYADHAEVAGPLFAEHDCPVTTFVATGFVDGRLWMWWDRIEHAFRHARRDAVALTLADAPWQAAWQDDAGRRAAQVDFTERCKRVPDAAKLAAIEALAAALEVALPAVPPPAYAPMTWEQLRRAESAGMSFAPHTVTHPVLARTPDAQSRHELEESWRRLAAEAAAPQRIFCYPNGGWADFGEREVATLRHLGFAGAVVGETGYAEARDARDEAGRFRLRRFAFPDQLPVAAQYAGGFERFKAVLRGQR